MGHMEAFGKEFHFEKIAYLWDTRNEAYISKGEWQIFSKDSIDDHSFDALLSSFQEEPSSNQWKLYFNTESPLDVHYVRKHHGVSTALNA